ncbi:MAG: hypothetical protein ACP5KN_13040 [Armatimonadota bacterium]
MGIRIAMTVIVASILASATGAWAELEILDEPMWVFPGQIFRIALRQPEGSGELAVAHPENVEMFDRWDQDERQRFYFRALQPGDALIRFSGRGGDLTVPVPVIPWSDVYTLREYRDVQLPRLWPMGEELAETKPGRTIHTEDEIEAMRESGGEAGDIAKRWLGMSDQQIWDIIPGPAIPRTCLMTLGVEPDDGVGKGCPVCGEAIYEGRSGFYPWIFDAEEHPWKVGCPNCGTWFPSNEWQEGDMHSGRFPDDGWGCEPAEPVLSPSGTPYRWPFIAYYHQWEAYMRTLTPGISQAADAYITTGDEAHAHSCAVALCRFAQAHLDMSLNLMHRKRAVRDGVYLGPVGAPKDSLIGRLGGSFSYIQPNWDTPRMEDAARAYDLIYPAIAEDEQLVAFLQSQYHPEVESPEDVHRFLQAGIIRTCAQYGIDNAVSRNWPIQERMVATMALAQGTPRAMDLVDHLLNGRPALRYSLSNQYLKDGAGHETGGYNRIQVRYMAGMAELFDGLKQLLPDLYRPPKFVSPADDPKFRQMYDFPLDASLIARTTDQTGDAGHPTTDPLPLRQGIPLDGNDFAGIYAHTRDPRFARAAWGPEGEVPDSVTDPGVAGEIERIGREQGWRLDLPSGILDGYGHAILRSGEGDSARALWLRYGIAIQHRHWDMLTMGLEALKRKMLPELGYPVGWTYAGVWEKSWGVHYGTHITGVSTSSFPIGGVSTFAASRPAQYARAASEVASGDEPRPRRERVIVLVDIDESDCYAVTLERVLGGEEHTWSFHGPSGPASVKGVELRPQGDGTVAGPDVPYRDMQHSPSGDGELRCLNFMPDPKVGELSGPWQIDYTLAGQDDVHLTVTTLTPREGRLFTSVCSAPGGKSPYEATWCIIQRSGEAPLASQYLTVLEPFEGRRRVRNIEPVRLSGDLMADAVPPLGLRVATDEFTDTIIIQPRSGFACATADGSLTTDAEFALWRERDGQLDTAVLVRGTALVSVDEGLTVAVPEYTGVIESCDWPGRTVRVRWSESLQGLADQAVWTGAAAGDEHRRMELQFTGASAADASALVGRNVSITNPAGNRASHRIVAAAPIDGGVELTLDYDARVGEGPVEEVGDGQISSGVSFHLDHFGYYDGKTVANEDGSAAYRFTHLDGHRTCVLDAEHHGQVAAEALRKQFTDRDGDGLTRMVLYDYGPGDTVTIPCWAVLSRQR